jgi:DNA-binding CsgD family transcriptional regulator
VELIGRNSNLDHLCKNWAELRKRIKESPSRPPFSHQRGPKPRSKRFLAALDIADIVQRYESGETTGQIGNRYGISKTRVATVLRQSGVTIRRQGLTQQQISEAVALYTTGRSLAWIGTRYGVSHTTVAAALRRQNVQLRARPGWI